MNANEGQIDALKTASTTLPHTTVAVTLVIIWVLTTTHALVRTEYMWCITTLQ